MSSIEKLLDLTADEIKKEKLRNKSIKINYKKLKNILTTLAASQYGSIEKMTEYLYNSGVFQYQWRKKKKNKSKEAIQEYIISCVELGALDSGGKLTNIGNILVDCLNNEKEYKKQLGYILRKREDVKNILKVVSKIKIPTSDEIKEEIRKNNKITGISLSNLINLLSNCGMLLENKKTTYYPLTLSSRIIDLIESTDESYTLDEINQIFKREEFSGVEIQEELTSLLVQDIIKLSESLPIVCLNLLKYTVKFKPSFVSRLTIKLTPEYFEFLNSKGINDAPKYINDLAKEHYQYLEIAPFSAKIELLTFKKIGPHNAKIKLK